jgi:hypothetical protein
MYSKKEVGLYPKYRMLLERLSRWIAFSCQLPYGAIFSPKAKWPWVSNAKKILKYVAYKREIPIAEMIEFLGAKGFHFKDIKEFDENNLEYGKWIVSDLTKENWVNKKLIYIAGKVSGEDYNRVVDKFNAAELRLIGDGHVVVNPVRLVPSTADWRLAMKILLPYLVVCDAIYLLRDWESSAGARFEKEIAEKIGMEIMYQ